MGNLIGRTDGGRRYNSNKSEADKARQETSELQNNCEHPNVVKKFLSNTRTYDTSEYDTNWVDCFCPDCGKRWTEE